MHDPIVPHDMFRAFTAANEDEHAVIQFYDVPKFARVSIPEGIIR